MAKLNKNYYYSKDGTRKIGTYVAYIPKAIVELSGIKETDNIKVYTEEKGSKKIIIEKDK